MLKYSFLQRINEYIEENRVVFHYPYMDNVRAETLDFDNNSSESLDDLLAILSQPSPYKFDSFSEYNKIYYWLQNAADEYEASCRIVNDDTGYSFQEMLLNEIKKRRLSVEECCARALIGASHFDHIMHDSHYLLHKETVISFALSLMLSQHETEVLLGKAGFKFLRNRKFDIIIEYCIKNYIYNLDTVNEILYAFDEKNLGAGIFY